jgi:hypothetical protein
MSGRAAAWRRLSRISRALSTPVAISLVAVVYIAIEWVPIRFLLGSTLPAPAVVVETWEREKEDATFWYVGYEFVDAAGSTFDGTSQVAEATFSRTNIGDRIEVRYVTGDPSVNRYTVDYPINSIELALGLFSLVAIPFSAAGVVLRRLRGRVHR